MKESDGCKHQNSRSQGDSYKCRPLYCIALTSHGIKYHEVDVSSGPILFRGFFRPLPPLPMSGNDSLLFFAISTKRFEIGTTISAQIDSRYGRMYFMSQGGRYLGDVRTSVNTQQSLFSYPRRNASNEKATKTPRGEDGSNGTSPANCDSWVSSARRNVHIRLL